jgi:hypothetical protein
VFACALGACAVTEDVQTISGRVERTGFGGQVLGARAVAGDRVVATAPVTQDGRFTLEVPVGTGYRLEVITSTGAQVLAAQATDDLVAATFDICDPGEPYDVGVIYQGDSVPACDPSTGEGCDPGCPDPNADGSCDEPGCDPTTDPTCGGGGDPGCDPATGENCDPGCTDPNPDGSCDEPPGCDPATGENCDPGCPDPSSDGSCGDDCPYDDPTMCWPPPDGEPCDPNGVCDPGGCAVPEQPVPDFGCGGW